MFVSIFNNLVENLRGTVPVSTAFIPKERAYELLKSVSGEDWGYDAEAWLARKADIVKRMETTTSRSKNIDELRAREVELRKQD
jgi:hypothetical protein